MQNHTGNSGMQDDLGFTPKKSGPGRYILVGCLSVVILALVALGAGGFYVATNWKGWAATASTETVKNIVRDTTLSTEEKRQVIARAEALAEEFRAGRLSVEEVTKIAKSLAESPLLPLAIVEGMDATYFRPSGLTDEEKAESRLLNGRIARGIFEETLAIEDLEPALDPLSEDGNANIQITRSGDGTTTGVKINLKEPENVTDDELREFMAQAKVILEEKGVPDEPFEVDLVAELDKAIEAAIGRTIEPLDAPEAPDEPSDEPDREDDADGDDGDG